MRRVAIVGLGLMGGSLGLALKRRCPGVEVRGCARRAEVRREALRRGAADAVCESPCEAVRGADVAVFCVPVLTISDLAEECLGDFAPGCVVTDVGSTKGEIVARLAPRFKGGPAAFVGSHPIAGSERAGLDAARDDLYAGAMVVVTPAPGEEAAPAVARATALWQSVGARTAVLSPDDHDRVMARTSHLPHLAASVLASVVCAEPGVLPFCGPGFRDTTRVAAGSEEVWHDIAKTNRAALSRELAAFAAGVEAVRGMVDRGEFDALRAYLADAARKRRACQERP